MVVLNFFITETSYDTANNGVNTAFPLLGNKNIHSKRSLVALDLLKRARKIIEQKMQTFFLQKGFPVAT